jgi:hypothetical protein
MFTYGYIDDLLLYWGVNLDIRRFDAADISKACETPRNFAKWRVCEVYLATEYLKTIGRKIEWTLEDSWKAFAEHFCIVDKDTVDFIWYKNDVRREFRYLCYDSVSSHQELNYREWSNLYTGLPTISEIPEHILDYRFDNFKYKNGLDKQNNEQ